jgi:glutamate-5-semialdehyde dehydrogenase
MQIKMANLEIALEKTRLASRRLANCTDSQINNILLRLADATIEHTESIIAANQLDLARMDPQDPKYDRLLLNPARLADIAADLRKVAELPSPVGKILESRTLPNGLWLKKRSVPLGVIGIVYESRPNVTFDVFALCIKSGNAVVLKGSRDAQDSNTAIVAIIQSILKPFGLEEVVYLAPSDREALIPIITANRYIDLVIPRGGKGLIDFVRQNATVPVIETGAGIVHVYFDASGDLAKGQDIIKNSKTRRVSVCNALDCVIVHEDRLNDLPSLFEPLVNPHQVELFADAQAFKALDGDYPTDLLHQATEEHFGLEFLSLRMAVKIVPNIEAAIEHIDRFSSRHSEAIVAEDPKAIEMFLNQLDSAVVYANASTAFTDGAQFGLGAEIGISTQKLHARGPMALAELTSYKWTAEGQGQIRQTS